MKTENVKLSALQNPEYFEFMNGAIQDIEQHIELNPLGQFARDIAMLLTFLKSCFVILDEAYKLTIKSAITRTLSKLDGVRDNDFSVLKGNVILLLKHFNTAIADAAYRVKIEIDSFGNGVQKNYNAETAAITNLIQVLRGKLAADVATLGLTECVDRLDASNIAFAEAFDERLEEQGEKNTLARMRDARLNTDGAYRAIVNRVNAAIEYNGPHEYAAFVNDINTRIKYYNDLIAHRKGVAAAKKEKEEGEQPAEEGNSIEN